MSLKLHLYLQIFTFLLIYSHVLLKIKVHGDCNFCFIYMSVLKLCKKKKRVCASGQFLKYILGAAAKPLVYLTLNFFLFFLINDICEVFVYIL